MVRKADLPIVRMTIERKPLRDSYVYHCRGIKEYFGADGKKRFRGVWADIVGNCTLDELVGILEERVKKQEKGLTEL